MDPKTFEYLKPTEEQTATMSRLRKAAQMYFDVLDLELPDGPDKTYVLRSLRTVAMWANVAVSRQPDGSPR